MNGAEELRLNEGEAWSYATRPGEETSFLVLRKIETLPKVGEVIHISIFDVEIESPKSPKGFTNQISHLPIIGPILRSSLKGRVTRNIPEVDWNEGYELWREANGGVFNQPVSDCVGFVEEALNSGEISQ